MFKNTIYYDKAIQTLEEALSRLHTIPYHALKYTQRIHPNSNYISQRHNHGIIELSFPPEISYITNIRNNHHSKMVTYVTNNETKIISQIIITPNTKINRMLHSDLKIIIYNLMQTNLIITYDAYLFKDVLKAKL